MVVVQNRSVYVPLTGAFCVYSNVYGLVDIFCIRYHTVVDPILSAYFPSHMYHHLTSGSVKIPVITSTDYSSSIGKEPVSYNRPISIRMSTTSS